MTELAELVLRSILPLLCIDSSEDNQIKEYHIQMS